MPAPPVVALYRADQSNIALLNQVEQRQSATNVAFGDAHDQAQVCQDELLHGIAVARFNALGQFDFPIVRNHGYAANFP